jgi:hypothetical protein
VIDRVEVAGKVLEEEEKVVLMLLDLVDNVYALIVIKEYLIK